VDKVNITSVALSAEIVWLFGFGRLVRYVQFEYSADPQNVADIMQAIGLLELTWTSERMNVAMTTQAFSLLSAVDKRLSPQAKSAWRWRILLLRAEVDALLAANGNQMVNHLHLFPALSYRLCSISTSIVNRVLTRQCCIVLVGALGSFLQWGPQLCKDMAELTAIQHANASSCCRPAQVPCSKPAPSPTPPSPAPTKECPNHKFKDKFVPWVRAANASNVFGVKEGVHNVGVSLSFFSSIGV
jgi:hypothetical protein